MSAPGSDLGPLPSHKVNKPEHDDVQKTDKKQKKHWKGRTVSKDDAPSHADLTQSAQAIVAKSTEPSPGALILPTQVFPEQTIERLVTELGKEWEKVLKFKTPNYSRLLNEKLIIQAIGLFLLKYRETLSTDKSTIDFLKKFSKAIEEADEETLFNVANLLIDDHNPAAAPFLYFCKNSPAFPRIVQQSLTPETAKHFVKLFAGDPEVRKGVIEVLKHRKEALPAIFYIAMMKCFSDKEWLDIGDQIGEREVFERFLEANQRNNFPHLLAKFTTFPSREGMERLTNTLVYRLPVTQEMFIGCIASHNIPGIARLLDTYDKQFIIDCREGIYKVLMAYRDPLLGKTIHEHAPYLAGMVAFENLENAAQDGNDWFIRWAHNKGRPVTPEEADKLLDISLKAANISLMKFLCGIIKGGRRQGADYFRKLSRLEKPAEPNKAEAMLMKLALFSPIEEFYAMMAYNLDWADTLEGTIDLLPLLVRFPSMSFTGHVGYSIQEQADYVDGTLKYAKQNRAVIDQFLPQLVDSDKNTVMPRSVLLEKIINERSKRVTIQLNIKTRDLYKTWRNDVNEEHYAYKTAFFLEENREFEAKTALRSPSFITLTIAAKPIRYSWCLKHLTELFYDDKTEELRAPEGTSVEVHTDFVTSLNFNYTYSYYDKQNKETSVTVPTTTLEADWMYHTHPSTIVTLTPHLEALNKEILTYDLDFTNPDSLKGFYEKVATGYWLIATLCEIERGTPHNAMIWLNLMYEHHNLPPPIPRIDHFFLDNTMIVTPIEIARQRWESYFEPPLDVALEKSDRMMGRANLSLLLKANGNLLRLCSPKARDDDKLVAIAIKSKPEAIRFASHRLQSLF